MFHADPLAQDYNPLNPNASASADVYFALDPQVGVCPANYLHQWIQGLCDLGYRAVRGAVGWG